MSSNVWMQFYVTDYCKKTTHLTTLEHGAYLLLIFHAWNHSGRIPKDDKRLALITRLSVRKWQQIKGTVLHFFVEESDSYTQDRVVEELGKTNAKREVARAAGVASGVARKTNGRSVSVRTDVQRKGERKSNQSESYTESEEEKSSASADADTALPRVSASGWPDVIPLDIKDVDLIFAYGVPMLVGANVADKAARSFLGSMRKMHGDPKVVDALRRMAVARPLDPIAWLTKVLGIPGGSRNHNLAGKDYGQGGSL